MKKTMIRAAVLLLAVPLALAGCSSTATVTVTPTEQTSTTTQDGADDAEDPGLAAETPEAELYEFATPDTAPAPSITVRIPQAVAEYAPDAVANLAQTEFTITGQTLASPEICAADIAVTYADGAVDQMVKTVRTIEPWDQDREERQAFLNAVQGGESWPTKWDGMTIEELVEMYSPNFDEAYEQMKIALEERKKEYEATSEVNPGANLVHTFIPTDIAKPIDDFDEADPVVGVYYSPDYATMTTVQQCAESSEDGTSRNVHFAAPTNVFGSSEESSSLADFGIGIMKNGTVFLGGGKIKGYETDANGDWIAD